VEWIQVCKANGIASSNFEYASLLREVALLGNVTLRAGFGKKYQWASVNIKVRHDSNAHQFLHHENRNVWSL
jgi:hypothetical protein